MNISLLSIKWMQIYNLVLKEPFLPIKIQNPFHNWSSSQSATSKRCLSWHIAHVLHEVAVAKVSKGLNCPFTQNQNLQASQIVLFSLSKKWPFHLLITSSFNSDPFYSPVKGNKSFFFMPLFLGISQPPNVHYPNVA